VITGVYSEELVIVNFLTEANLILVVKYRSEEAVDELTGAFVFVFHA
jgi:hypothetical protein